MIFLICLYCDVKTFGEIIHMLAKKILKTTKKTLF